MYKIEISDETAESMFRDILIEDYRRVRGEIYDLNERRSSEGSLPNYAQEDFEANTRFLEAMKVLMEYYLPLGDAQKIIGEA
jgi:hypothetical protein